MTNPQRNSLTGWLVCRWQGHDWIYSAPGWSVRKCCRRCGEVR